MFSVNINFTHGRYSLISRCDNEIMPTKYLLAKDEKEKLMCRIEFTMEQELYQTVNSIILCPKKNKEVFLIKEEVKFDNLTNPYSILLLIEDIDVNNYNLSNETITVKFMKAGLDPNKYWKLINQVIYEEDIILPKINLNPEDECSICLEEVNDDVYLSECGHFFHFKCIWKHSKHNNNTLYLDGYCHDCDHGKKLILHFECPLCRKVSV